MLQPVTSKNTVPVTKYGGQTKKIPQYVTLYLPNKNDIMSDKRERKFDYDYFY